MPSLRSARAVRVLYRPPKQEPLTLVRGFFIASSTNPRQSRTVQDSNRAAAHSAVSKATVRLCLARGSQRLGMSTKKDAARLIRVGSFCFGGWYRTRTAAEATAACGGNREPRLGQRPAEHECRSRHEVDAGSRNPGADAVSGFQKPCQLHKCGNMSLAKTISSQKEQTWKQSTPKPLPPRGKASWAPWRSALCWSS